MVVPQIEARDALKKRLEGVFEPEAFGKLYPGYERPKVTLGFPVNEPPFYVAVDEIATNVQPGKGSSYGEVQIEFVLNVWVFARKTELEAAANTAIVYADAVFAAVCADQTLKGSVDLAVPSVSQGGTAADADRKYIATETVEIRCSTWSKCPHEIRELIHESDL